MIEAESHSQQLEGEEKRHQAEKQAIRERNEAFLDYARLKPQNLSVFMERSDLSNHRLEECMIESVPKDRNLNPDAKKADKGKPKQAHEVSKYGPVFYAFKRIYHLSRDAREFHEKTFKFYSGFESREVLLKLHYQQLSLCPSKWVTISQNYDRSCFAILWDNMNDPVALNRLVNSISDAIKTFHGHYEKELKKSKIDDHRHQYSLSDFKVISVADKLIVKFDWTSCFSRSPKQPSHFLNRALYVLALTATARDQPPTSFHATRSREKKFENMFEEWSEGINRPKECSDKAIIVTNINRFNGVSLKQWQMKSPISLTKIESLNEQSHMKVEQITKRSSFSEALSPTKLRLEQSISGTAQHSIQKLDEKKQELDKEREELAKITKRLFDECYMREKTRPTK